MALSLLFARRFKETDGGLQPPFRDSGSSDENRSHASMAELPHLLRAPETHTRQRSAS
jgi:hypothetical protein